MNFDLSEEQKMLAEQATNLLAETSAPDRLRQLIETGAEWDEPLWKSLQDMGFCAAAIAEEHGGLGLGDIELGLINLELGRANACVPFFSSIVLATSAIQLAGSEEQKSRLLPSVASGSTIATFAYAEGPAGWSPNAIHSTFENGKLTGTKTPVADAGIASLAIVLVKYQGALRLAAVRLDQLAVTREKLNSFDQLRAHYALTFTEAGAELLDGPEAATVLAQLFDKAAIQAAFEAVGGAEACLKMARDYAMERQIFGRPLAGYQAIKHKLADIVTAIELAKSNAYYAGWAATNTPEDLATTAACARLSATTAFESAARENLQIHGGIGYTFEANCHFYYRRERSLALSLGGREFWASRLITHLHPTNKAA